jgi:hypothetical protein
MKKMLQSILVIAACFSVSNLSAFVPPPDMMKLYEGRKAMAFGSDKTSEVYIFTDWSSQDSVKLEPVLEAIAPQLMKSAKIYFMTKETPDTENLNIANFSALGRNPKNLEQYFKIRKVLFQLAAEKKNPTVEDIKAAVKPLNATYAPLKKEFTDILVKLNRVVNGVMQVKQYPTMVLYNLANSTSKTITVPSEMTQANVLKELDNLKVPKATPSAAT